MRPLEPRRVLCAVVAVALLSSTRPLDAKAAVTAPAVPADRRRPALDCAAALKVALPTARVTAARAVQPNDSLRALGRKPHCRVEATVDEETRIVALLPDDWNGRFLMGGAGGFAGELDNQFASTVHEGYATVGTDAGHKAHSLTAGWALNNDRRIADYGHRAVHRTAEVTKALIVAYYGRPISHSYFIGCSNGGRQALMEAQRYPADFDGIVAIAPALNFLEIATTFVRNLQAMYPTGAVTSPIVTPDVLELLAQKVTETCDAIDGVRDGSLENPDACTLRLASLPACPNDLTSKGCVTRAQRAALTTITAPLRAGTLRYPAQPYGDEADPEGWGAWITGPLADVVTLTSGSAPTVQGAFGTEFFKYFVYGDSTWKWLGYDLARAGRDGAKVDAVVSATNPDLSAFQARGGKLLLAHGWSDPALNARATIDYFKAVQTRTPNAASFTRLFMMPGVLHCAGGSGCDDVDFAGIIRSWVEQGEAPSRVVARKLRGSQVVRTHPLCSYPMTARYNGTGSTDDASAFSCK
ncbi:tannase/feruloyl esterase family alpha/beta hydrolase [Gemmatimonas sp.]|uniref:tannase/feruloyl esterase family alpha/beta hydrolase n=1 Tax=Gemmatimonas sp. TaxID=1962908 RepID=UPI00286E10FB|nr:tannase/feruloyl esterase family alpha/beta hydrolase [Gemmatimonas sp.]